MDKALQSMINNMPEKTGKSLAEWLHVLAPLKDAKHGEKMKLLKGTHGVSHGFANTICALSNGDNSSDEDLITNQYKGKEALFPIYEKLTETVKAFGSDVIIIPKKGSVSLVRKRQFALIKPATKTRIDLGLKLKDVAINGRLESSGPFGTMCTHRVKINAVSDLDEEITDWLRLAFEKAG